MIASSEISPVRRVKIDRACEIWAWLCPSAVVAREAKGWTVKQSLPAPPENPHLTCDDRDTGCCHGGANA